MDIQNVIIEKVGVDRLLHMAFGGWISSFFDVPWQILLTGLCIGLFKDVVIDKLIRKTACDWMDIAWTFGGSVITVIIKLIIIGYE